MVINYESKKLPNNVSTNVSELVVLLFLFLN